MVDLAAIRAIARDVEWNTLGVPVALPLGPDNNDLDERLEIQGIWLTFQPEELPGASSLQRAVPRKVMALRRDEVPTAARGLWVEAPEMIGGAVKFWRVDGYLEQRDDHHRVILVETDEQPDEDTTT